MTFANSIPDCVPASQMQEDDSAHEDWRLCHPQRSSPRLAPSCQHASHNGAEALQLETAAWSGERQLCIHHGLHKEWEQ